MKLRLIVLLGLYFISNYSQAASTTKGSTITFEDVGNRQFNMMVKFAQNTAMVPYAINLANGIIEEGFRHPDVVATTKELLSLLESGHILSPLPPAPPLPCEVADQKEE